MLKAAHSLAAVVILATPAAAPPISAAASHGRAELPFRAIFKAECGSRYIERAAQAKAESRLDPKVVAFDGGQGLGQAMPGTWADYQRRGWVPPGASPFDPTMAIRGMHRYDQWLEARIPVLDGYLVGYNAGPGSAARALQHAKDLGLSGPDVILRTLPRVTGEQNAAITTAYVARNRRYRADLAAQEARP